MPDPRHNPANEAFAAALHKEAEMVFAQVLVRPLPSGAGFDLRHVEDRFKEARDLRPVEERALRALSQFTAAGAFRPLKAAPNLPGGWRLTARDAAGAARALHELYPGAIADWFAAQSPCPPTTSYRLFTGRQTGMYEATARLADDAVAEVIRNCCDASRCLKRRLWTNAALPPDDPAAKSIIPCLEPCAILLEAARTHPSARQPGAANSLGKTLSDS